MQTGSSFDTDTARDDVLRHEINAPPIHLYLLNFMSPQERSVWTAAAVLATAATVPPIGRGAAVLFKYGNKTMDVLRHAKADEDSIEERAEPKRWFKRFIVVYWQSTWFVVGKISLRIGLTEMANQFFCEDVPANFRVLVYGTKKPEPQWTPHAWMRRFLRLVALVLDIFGVLYFVGHLASAAIEVFITLIGAVWVCLAFSWTYTRYWCKVKGDDRVVAWEHLLACKGCREGDSCADKSMECSKHRMLPSI